MVIAFLNNMPELIGFIASSGLAFWLGRRFERRWGSK